MHLPHLENFIKRLVTSVLLIIIFYILYAFFPAWVLSLIIGGLGAYVLFFEWPAFRLWWLTPLYPLFPFVCAIYCNQVDQFFLILISCIVFSHDTGSYLVGNWCGRSKIAPVMSPGKTWEGFWGGYVLSCLLTYTYLAYSNVSVSIPFLLFGVLLVDLASLAGDLFESALKRRVHRKDSGNVLPGHGGLLDRFDGFMVALTLFLPLRIYIEEVMKKL